MVFCNELFETLYAEYAEVTILILIDGFLQFTVVDEDGFAMVSHNPYFNRWFSAIKMGCSVMSCKYNVTILILIDGFLQYLVEEVVTPGYSSHNPYFNRWFSAI